MTSRSSSGTPLLVAGLAAIVIALGAFAWFVLGDDGSAPDSTGAVIQNETAQPDQPGALPDPVDVPTRPVEDLGDDVLPTPVQAIMPVVDGPAGAIAGRVIGPDELPVAGVELTVYRGNNLISGSFPGAKQKIDGVAAVSDDEGRFVLEPVPVGQPYVVIGEHESYARSERGGIRVRRDETTEGVELRMESGARIYGTVFTVGAVAPIPNAQVELYYTLDMAFLPPDEQRPWKVVLTGNNGAFSFDHVASPSIKVRVAAEGYESQSRSISYALEGRARDQELQFELGPGHLLAGLVTDDRGAPVPDARVEITALTKDFQGNVIAVSDKAGRFLLEGVGEHPYHLRATARGHADTQIAQVSLDEGELHVIMKRRGSVHGWVRSPSGAPVTRFELHLMKVHPGRPPTYMGRQQGYQSPDGSFVFSDVDSGLYALEARAPGYAHTRSAEFNVGGPDSSPPETTITMSRGGTVSGRVLAPDGKGLKGATVAVNENNFVESHIGKIFEQLVPSGLTSYAGETDEEGRFSISAIPPGTYQVAAKHPDWAAREINDVAVIDDDLGKTPPLDITLLKGGSITGRALDEASRPLAHSRVQLSQTGGGAGFVETSTTDADGNFEFTNLKGGVYSLTLSPEREPDGRLINPILRLVYSQRSSIEIALEDGQDYGGVKLYLKRE